MSDQKKCPKCGGETQFDQWCAARVCADCGNHLGLTRCFCGWAVCGGILGPVVEK